MFMLLASFAFLLHQLSPTYGVTWEIGDYPLPQSLFWAATVSFDDSITYIFGGERIIANKQTAVNTIYKLDTTVINPSWQLLSVTMPVTNIKQFEVVKVGKLVYFYASRNTKFVVFDATTETFLDNTNIAHCPYYTYSSSISTDGINYIYLLGGQNTVSQYVQRYDIANNEWQLLSSNAPLQWFWLNTIYYEPQNKIYVFGGYSPATSYFKDIYYFDLNTNTWSNPIGAVTLNSILYSNTIYIPKIDTIYIISLSSNEVNKYEPISNIITTETSTPFMACASGLGASVTTLNNRLQVFAGRDKVVNCRTEQLYTSPPKQEIKWEIGDYALPKTIRDGVSISFDDNIVYLFGGYDMLFNGLSLRRSTTIYKLDTTANTPSWQELSAVMPSNYIIDRNYFVKIGNMVYFYEGREGSYSAKFYVFNTITDTFLDSSNIANNPYWKHGTFGQSVSTNGNNYIFVTGGYHTSQYVARYDIQNNKWQLLSHIAPFDGVRLNTIYYPPQNRIYVFGGYDWSKMASFYDIYYFDLNTNTWSNQIATMTLNGPHGAETVYIPTIDTIFIIQQNGQSIGSYNPKLNTFKTETPRNSVYASCGIYSAVTSLNNRLQLFGGAYQLYTLQNGNCRTQELW